MVTHSAESASYGGRVVRMLDGHVLAGGSAAVRAA
jgi:hypothetical protein